MSVAVQNLAIACCDQCDRMIVLGSVLKVLFDLNGHPCVLCVTCAKYVAERLTSCADEIIRREER